LLRSTVIAIAGGCCVAGVRGDYRIMANQEIRIGIPELRVGVPFPTIALEIIALRRCAKHFPSMLYGGATFSPGAPLTRV
jgi:enoyl-CoA hydratase